MYSVADGPEENSGCSLDNWSTARIYVRRVALECHAGPTESN